MFSMASAGVEVTHGVDVHKIEFTTCSFRKVVGNGPISSKQRQNFDEES